MPSSSVRADTLRTRQAIIDCLRTLETEGLHPIAREISERCRIPHSTVRRHIAALQADGTVAIRDRPVMVIRKEIMLVPAENAHGI